MGVFTCTHRTVNGTERGNAMSRGPAWERLIAHGTRHTVVIRNLSWDTPVSPWHQLLCVWRAGEGSLTLPRGTSGPKKGGHSCPLMPSAWCFPMPSCGFSWEEWTSKVALGAGLLAQPPESPLNWHPASLNPELLHPGTSNGRD